MTRRFTIYTCWLLCFILRNEVAAQHEADNWTFGQEAGLTFSPSGTITAFKSRMQQFEGGATMSDPATGELLFYSDGRSVWNRNHLVMPDGNLLVGGAGYTSQPALIVPFPGKTRRYYLFTNRVYNQQGDDGTLGGLYYSVIDLSLNQGSGNVVAGTKNTLVEQFSTEKLTAVPHANGRDFWILAHKWNSDEFLVYLLTPDGLSAARRIAIGTIHRDGPPGLSEAKGYLKASPDGRYLAAAVYGENRPFELYDFDNRTGTISNYRSLGNFTGQYGVSFSPDNSKLYLSGIYQLGLIGRTRSYQFDLSTPAYKTTEITLIDSTRSGEIPYYIHGALQLGIDGKLYGAVSEAGRLVIINKPNQAGEACEPRYIYFDFKGGMPQIGLPNFMQHIFNQNPGSSLNVSCAGSLLVFPNPVIANTLYLSLADSDCPFTKLHVYDVSGRLIACHDSLPVRSLTIDTTLWAAGMYLLVFDFEGRRVTRKVVKQ